MRKLPAKEKNISDISKEDTRVSIIATVVSKDDVNYSMKVDDGTSTITVLCDRLYGETSLIRVVGKPFESDGELTLNSEIITDFSKFDLELYKKIKEKCEI